MHAECQAARLEVFVLRLGQVKDTTGDHVDDMCLDKALLIFI